MTPRVLVSHPFGNPNAYQVARGLHLKGCLASFATCIYAPLGTSFRSDQSLPKRDVQTGGLREGFRVALAHSRILSQTARSAGMIDWVARAHDLRVARRLTRNTKSPDTNLIWGYEDFAASSFERARALTIKTIYDLPTVHHLEARRIYEREVEGDSSLAQFLSPGLEPEHRLRRKEAELALADVVVCASSFVRKSLIQFGWPASRLRVLPYGVSAPTTPTAAKRAPHPLRLRSCTPARSGRIRAFITCSGRYRVCLTRRFILLWPGSGFRAFGIGSSAASGCRSITPAAWRLPVSKPNIPMLTCCSFPRFGTGLAWSWLKPWRMDFP